MEDVWARVFERVAARRNENYNRCETTFSVTSETHAGTGVPFLAETKSSAENVRFAGTEVPAGYRVYNKTTRGLTECARIAFRSGRENN